MKMPTRLFTTLSDALHKKLYSNTVLHLFLSLEDFERECPLTAGKRELGVFTQASSLTSLIWLGRSEHILQVVHILLSSQLRIRQLC